MNAVRVPWSSASFLVYLGGLTIFIAIIGLLTVASDERGAFGFVFWSALLLVVLQALASGTRRSGHLVTAGLFAISAVAAFVVFLGALLDWFGWFPNTDSAFSGFRFWLLFLELATVVSASIALRIFRFPLLVLGLAAAWWFFVTDLISGGGNWSAIVTIAYGLVLLTVAMSFDAGRSRIYGFWLHVASGLAIGGGLIWFFHDSSFDWIVIGVVALFYIGLGDVLKRSSWAVLGAFGFLLAANYFADKWSDSATFPFAFIFGFDGSGSEGRPWAGPLTFAVVGLFFIVLALSFAHRRRDATPAAELL